MGMGQGTALWYLRGFLGPGNLDMPLGHGSSSLTSGLFLRHDHCTGHLQRAACVLSMHHARSTGHLQRTACVLRLRHAHSPGHLQRAACVLRMCISLCALLLLKTILLLPHLAAGQTGPVKLRDLPKITQLAIAE